MDHRKLFQVLVIGGAVLGGGCTETPPDGGDDTGAPGGDAAGPDAATPMLDDTAPSDAMPGELEECGFCPNECCVTDEETGESRARDGFMCCWGTSC